MPLSLLKVIIGLDFKEILVHLCSTLLNNLSDHYHCENFVHILDKSLNTF